MNSEVAPQDGSTALEAALDEVITHLREELVHGEWPAARSGRG